MDIYPILERVVLINFSAIIVIERFHIADDQNDGAEYRVAVKTRSLNPSQQCQVRTSST